MAKRCQPRGEPPPWAAPLSASTGALLSPFDTSGLEVLASLPPMIQRSGTYPVLFSAGRSMWQAATGMTEPALKFDVLDRFGGRLGERVAGALGPLDVPPDGSGADLAGPSRAFAVPALGRVIGRPPEAGESSRRRSCHVVEEELHELLASRAG